MIKKALVFWFTGLSGSGKTTVAKRVKPLLEAAGFSVLLLDGDDIRRRLHTNLGFGEQDIKKNNALIAGLCRDFRGGYDIILVSIISPYISSREQARVLLGKGFYEIYFSVDLETLIKRDVKGLYAKAKRNEIPNLIGYSPGALYEAPKSPDFIINSSQDSIKTSVSGFYKFIVDKLKSPQDMIEPKENIKKIFRTPSDYMDRIGRIVRLDKNERTIPFPEGHFKRILNNISAEEITAYPELEPFYKKLARWLKVNGGQLLLTSGSDTGIRAVYEVYIDKGDEVLIFPPTYAMYSVYCDMFGGIRREIFYRDDLSLSLNEVLSAINKKTKLIAIANPNHTGTPLPRQDLLEILKVAKENESLVLVDEAYHHFYNFTVLPYIKKFQNLIVVRTFSKAFGIAGLRVGYLVSNKDIISQLYKVKLTHEITSISAKIGEYLVDHLEIMKDYVKDVNKGKEYLSKEFAKLGVISAKSYTNFIFAKLPEKVNAELLVSLLKERRFSISGPFSAAPLKGFIRITVGPVRQMQDFMSAFKSVYAKACR